jgi:hypothetical protein
MHQGLSRIGRSTEVSTTLFICGYIPDDLELEELGGKGY